MAAAAAVVRKVVVYRDETEERNSTPSFKFIRSFVSWGSLLFDMTSCLVRSVSPCGLCLGSRVRYRMVCSGLEYNMVNAQTLRIEMVDAQALSIEWSTQASSTEMFHDLLSTVPE